MIYITQVFITLNENKREWMMMQRRETERKVIEVSECREIWNFLDNFTEG
jgi:hypothetical protein